MATTAGLTDLRSGDPVTWERPGTRKAWGAELIPAIFEYFGPKLAAIRVEHKGEVMRKFVPLSQLKAGHRRFFMK